MKKRTRMIKDHCLIKEVLNDYFSLNLSPTELETEAGFRKIVAKLQKQGMLNAYLTALKIDLKSFEDICSHFNCRAEIFQDSLVPAIKRFIHLNPRFRRRPAKYPNQVGEFIPDDSCARQQPVYG